MNDRWTDPSPQDMHRGLFVAAAALAAAGAVLGLAGLAVGAAAVVVSGRRWTHRVDLSPNDLARLKWQQVRAAAGAGVGAWRDTEPARRD
ncbi:MAG TPA: hypothetical protein VHV74_27690 [Pseudonocardiaceae bacterium]|jgi:hypothetical protein|nr:hypothetical protein [Pseudonocardiaceae bacterium]